MFLRWRERARETETSGSFFFRPPAPSNGTPRDALIFFRPTLLWTRGPTKGRGRVALVTSSSA
eukprot:scaffold243552_cov32-Tisochrysis_lutea.AAC.1